MVKVNNRDTRIPIMKKFKKGTDDAVDVVVVNFELISLAVFLLLTLIS